jgi:2-dehydro-3-deoxyphosphogluconate aldolase/(4S)-4-hydroxy-2-oxoglutarate aldolase
MEKPNVYEILVRTGVVPVIRADSAHDTLKVVQALEDGGVPVAEITMTTPGAIGIIADLVRTRADRLTVGAGTVTDLDSCLKAMDAGSSFIVTPTCNQEIVDACARRNICIIGGGLTPTEVLENWRAGATAVKIFPASVFGPRYLTLLNEPFPDIPLVPTGGISLENVSDYLRAGAVFVGAGGDLVPKAAVREGKFQEITERARRYVSTVRSAREPSASS